MLDKGLVHFVLMYFAAKAFDQLCACAHAHIHPPAIFSSL